MAVDTGPPSDTEYMDEPNFRNRNTAVGAAVGEFVRTTLGPRGMEKMLVDTNGMVLITNDTKTILGEMGINLNLLPSTKLLKEAAIEQDDAMGDGAATSVVIAGELFRHAEKLFEKGLHPTTVAHGYELAARRTRAEIANASTEMRFDDTDRLAQIVRTSIAGSGSGQDADVIAPLLVEAARELARTGDLGEDRLSIKRIAGGTVADSSLMWGVAIEGDPVHSGMPRFLEPAKIACLNTNLTPEETSVEYEELEVQDPDEIDSLLALEAETLHSKIESVIASGANAVFSDASIDKRAQQIFAERGVLALRRIATDDLQKIADTTGASVTDSHLIEPEDVGKSLRIEHQNLGGDNVISIETEDPGHISLVLRGGTDQVLKERERATQGAFRMLCKLYDDQRFVPGGGAIEMRASTALREYASSTDSREQLAIDAFAEALETIPRSIADNVGLDPVDVVSEMRHQHNSGNETAGVHAFERCVDDTIAAGIVDPVPIKQQAVLAAADVVSRIIRIDDILKAETDDDLK